MKRKLLPIIAAALCAAMVMGLSGCGSDSKTEDTTTQAPAATDAASTDAADNTTTAAPVAATNGDVSKIVEYMSTAQLTNSVEELNALFGFNGVEEKTDSVNKCTWTFSEDADIVALRKDDGSIFDLKADFDEELITAKSDFSRYSEIKDALDAADSLTYDAFVEIVGGVQGAVVEKGDFSNSYKWVNSDGGYLKASFSVSSNECTFVSGWF